MIFTTLYESCQLSNCPTHCKRNCNESCHISKSVMPATRVNENVTHNNESCHRCERALNYEALLWKMTYKYKVSYASSPPCMIRTICKVSLFCKMSLFGKVSLKERIPTYKKYLKKRMPKCLLQVDRKKHPPPGRIPLLNGFQTKNPEQEDPPWKTTPILSKIVVVL